MIVATFELLVVLDIENPVEEVFTTNIPGVRRLVENTEIATLVESFAFAHENVEEVEFAPIVTDVLYCWFWVLRSVPKTLVPL